MITTESEFLKFSLSKYDNPHLVSLDEFEADLKRFTYLNNLLNRYRDDRCDLKDKLIINHIVILCNCFTVHGALVMLRYKIIAENKSSLDTFLYYLNLLEKTDQDLDFYLLDILNEN